MFVILAYDVGEKRSGRTRKIVKKYLRPVQRSVFEGVITERGLKDLKRELRRVVDPEQDTVTIYRLPSERYAIRDELGQVGNTEPMFL